MKTCAISGKIKHFRRWHADAHSRYLAHRGIVFRVYCCPHCGSFHITKQLSYLTNKDSQLG